MTVDVSFENISIDRRSIIGDDLELEEDPQTVTIDRWTGPENWKAKFEAESVPNMPSPQEVAMRTELLNATTTKLETQLAAYQHELYGRVTNELTNGALHAVAVEAGGAKALLDSFVTLGLSRAVDNDDFIHAMLYGNQQLIGDSQIVQSYALSTTQPITGANIMINQRLVIGQKVDQRKAAFAGLINHYLDAITTKTHVEDLDYIANARRELDLTVRIAQVEGQPLSTPSPTPSPTPDAGQPTPTPAPSADTNQVYLPLVER